MDDWNEIRSAYHVVRLGTVSAAAEALGVHRATVIRHIDALEAELGQKVFYRHARGYTPTDVGQDLLRAAEAAEASFADFVGRAKGRATSLSGDFIVTSMGFLSPMIMPVLASIRQKHPNLTIRYLVSQRLFRLEYGECHIAVRAGLRPKEPDHVVQHFRRIEFALFASRGYIDEHGMPQDRAALTEHSFVELEREVAKAGFQRWLDKWIPDANVRFRSSSPKLIEAAIVDGMGIGFLPVHSAAQQENLVTVLPYRRPWHIDSWVVTHVDVHRSAKVQVFLQMLKAQGNAIDH